MGMKTQQNGVKIKLVNFVTKLLATRFLTRGRAQLLAGCYATADGGAVAVVVLHFALFIRFIYHIAVKLDCWVAVLSLDEGQVSSTAEIKPC